MSDEKIYTQADLDAAVANALKPSAAVPLVLQPVAEVGKLAQVAKIFYHLYVCPSLECLKASNPQPGSWHQRGVHLASDKPRSDIRCPGSGTGTPPLAVHYMVIGRDGCDAKGNALPDGQVTSDRDGNAVLHGRVIVQEAPNMPDQTAEIEAENATGSIS